MQLYPIRIWIIKNFYHGYHHKAQSMVNSHNNKQQNVRIKKKKKQAYSNK